VSVVITRGGRRSFSTGRGSSTIYRKTRSARAIVPGRVELDDGVLAAVHDGRVEGVAVQDGDLRVGDPEDRREDQSQRGGARHGFCDGPRGPTLEKRRRPSKFRFFWQRTTTEKEAFPPDAGSRDLSAHHFVESKMYDIFTLPAPQPRVSLWHGATKMTTLAASR
jgi:hypothetical protein